MEKKKDLAKLAVAALLLASTLPVDGQAHNLSEFQETFLAAAGCGSCRSHRNEVADNATSNDSYNARSNTYQTGNYGTAGANGSYTDANVGSGYSGRSSYDTTGTSGSYTGTSGSYTGTSGTGTGMSSYGGKTSGSYSNTDAGRMNRDINASRNTNESYNPTRTYNDSYGNYNVNRSYNANPGYVDTYRSSTYEVDVDTPVNYGTSANFNRDYNTTSDFDYNRTTVTATGTLTEAQLLGMLNPQGRAIYMSLDPEGKSLAIQLASQDSYRDKNLAVKEAQRKINEKRGLMSR